MENEKDHERRSATGTDGLRTLERGLAVLELLGGAERGFPVSEVARRLGLSLGVCHRLLGTLVKAGYVEQDPRTRWYELGTKVLELRGAAALPTRISAQARPFLRDLMLRANLRVHLAIYRGGDVIYIDRVDTTDTLNRYVPAGRRSPAYATSLGKAILAFLRNEDLDAYLGRTRFVGFTSTTVTSVDELRAQLRLVKERGYALDLGEKEADTHCVGAPILDYTGYPIAAISVAGPAATVDADLPRLSALVAGTSHAISRRFGYHEDVDSGGGAYDIGWATDSITPTTA